MKLVQKHSKHMIITLNLAFKCTMDITLDSCGKGSQKLRGQGEGK